MSHPEFPTTPGQSTGEAKTDEPAMLRQLEDLERELDRRRRAEEVLRILATGTATATGDDFFRPLVQCLATALRTRCVFVTECTDVTMTRVRTLAYMENNRFEENLEYDLAGTPCELVIGGSVAFFPARLGELFPKEAGMESYLGVPIHDLAGQKVIGHLAIVDDRPRQQEALETSILQIFAARAGAELERKRALEALQEAHDALELRVEARTADLTTANQQLKREIVQREQAQREQAQLIAELDAFAHTVAHDLKNPLSIVTAHVEVLEEEWSTGEERQNAMRAIARGARKMDAIIRELLLLAQARNKTVVREPLNMATIVYAALQRLDLFIADRQAIILLPSEWPAALGHAPWVEEIWENYVSNAIKYGGEVPRVEVGATIQPGGVVCFWVQDNGDGLTQSEQAELFLPFVHRRQGDRKGHGLGLSIVQRITEKLGGEVGIVSEGLPGKGCRFWFSLPAA